MRGKSPSDDQNTPDKSFVQAKEKGPQRLEALVAASYQLKPSSTDGSDVSENEWFWRNS